MFNAGKRGQGMTEYIIIVALVAIALIVIVAVFGENIKEKLLRYPRKNV